MVLIREATDADLDDVLSVERQAFGGDEEAGLVAELLEDSSAQPLLSLLAYDNDHAAGHILFSRAHLEGSSDLSISILAPLAVVPESQNQGIGGELIKKGVGHLSDAEVDLVFVLGYPDYYRRHEFRPAGVLGFTAPYPIPEVHADAWMVRALASGVIGSVSGKVLCCDALNRPEYWRE